MMSGDSNSGKKRLCIVTPSHWSGSYGGAEFQVRLLVDEVIRQNDYDLTYISKNIDANFRPAGYEIRKIVSGGLSHKIGKVIDSRELYALLEDADPDVIYQRVGCAYTGVAAYYAKRKRRRMIWHVSSDADVMPEHPDKQFSGFPMMHSIEKKFLEYGIRHSDFIITQTMRQSELLLAHYGRQVGAIVSNYQPIPKEAEKPSSPINVLWISNLKPMKRPDIFLRLARDLAAENVVFTMIGRPSSSRWGRSLLNEIQREGNIRYLGERSQKEVDEIMASGHILVNTSSYEGFPNTFIQAWLRQTPVVSLDVDPDDILKTRDVGIFAGAYERLRAGVEQLINDRELRESMGMRASTYAMKEHSLSNIEKIIEIL